MKIMVKKKVFVAMSGGVDSSVAAALLKERGFNVTGVHMKCYNIDGCGERDAEDARRVAEQLHIPFYVFDFEKEYKKNVVQYMIRGYERGVTPNPDVMCNKEIKFGIFLKKARALGADYIATGHYVRIKSVIAIRQPAEKQSRRYSLIVARDKNKDQSYFLWTLTQEQLKYCLFPIGDYIKPQVRRLAKKYHLLTAEKKDSQGVCFLGQIKLEDFLKQYIKEKPGNIIDINGDVIGRHRGIEHYTIGQRHLGIKNLGFGTPHYVVAKDIKANTITIAHIEERSLYKKEIELTNVNLINPKLEIKNLELEIPVYARVRYRQPLVLARLSYNLKPKTYNLVFDKPQPYVASGQSAVLYSKKGEVLGGGVIE